MRDPDIAASLRGEHDYRPKEDIVLALQRDLFDFVMVARLDPGDLDSGAIVVNRLPLVTRNA